MTREMNAFLGIWVAATTGWGAGESGGWRGKAAGRRDPRRARGEMEKRHLRAGSSAVAAAATGLCSISVDGGPGGRPHRRSTVDGGQGAAGRPERHLQQLAHRALAHVAQHLVKAVGCGAGGRTGAALVRLPPGRASVHAVQLRRLHNSRGSGDSRCHSARRVRHSLAVRPPSTAACPAPPRRAQPLTAGVGALRVRVAGLHKGLHLLQVGQLDEIEAPPLELVVVELAVR